MEKKYTARNNRMKIKNLLEKLRNHIPGVENGLIIKNQLEIKILQERNKIKINDSPGRKTSQRYYINDNIEAIKLHEKNWQEIDKMKIKALQELQINKKNHRKIRIPKLDEDKIMSTYSKLMQSQDGLLRDISKIIKTENVILNTVAKSVRRINEDNEQKIYEHEYQRGFGSQIIENLEKGLETSTKNLLAEKISKESIGKFLSAKKSLIILERTGKISEMQELMTLILLHNYLENERENAKVTAKNKKLNREVIINLSDWEKILGPKLKEWEKLENYFPKVPLEKKEKNEKPRWDERSLASKVKCKLNEYKRKIGVEATNVLYKSGIAIKCPIYENVGTKRPKRLIIMSIKISELIYNAGIEMPRISNINENDAYNKRFMITNTGQIKIIKKEAKNTAKQEDETSPKEVNDEYDRFGKGKLLTNNIKHLFTTKYSIDLTTVLDWVRSLYNILEIKTQINTILSKKKYLKFIGDLYGINLERFAENLPTKLTSAIIKDCLAFDTLHSYEKKKEKQMMDSIWDLIQSKKIIINDILLNITVLYRFKHFSNHHHLDFRGRWYPSGTFHYLNPWARNFIMFEPHLSLNTNKIPYNYEKEVLTSLQQQLEAYLKTPENIQKVNEIINDPTHPTIFWLLTNLTGSIEYIYIKKLVIDIINIKNKNQWPFIGFYGLDASGSGCQLLCLLFKLKHLARYCGIAGDEDLYTTINDDVEKYIQCTIFSLIESLAEQSQGTLPIIINEYNSAMENRPKGAYEGRLSIKEVTWHADTLMSLIKTHCPNTLCITSAALDDLYVKYGQFLYPLDHQILHLVCKGAPTKSKYVKLIKSLTKLNLSQLPVHHQYLYIILIYQHFYKICQGGVAYGLGRKKVKQAVMTDLYGSTSRGKANSLYNAIITEALENGILYNSKDLGNINYYCIQISKCITNSVKTLFPESLAFIHKIKSLCKEKKMDIDIIESPQFHYSYNPVEIDYYFKKFVNKSYRITWVSDRKDFKQMGKSFVANYVQHCDSELARIIYSQVLEAEQELKRRIPMFLIHDRYVMHVFYTLLLQPLIQQGYKEFFKLDLIRTHFKDQPEILDLIEKIDPLTLENFIGTRYVKP